MIRACALIAVLISGALIDVARGADRVECEPQRVTGDGRYWAYRIVDGRECWYPGRPGKPKNELFWGRGITPSARQPVDQPEAETEPSEPPSRFVSAPPEQPESAPPEQPETTEAMPKQWRASAADQLLAFTCCWPELEEPAPLPKPTSELGPELEEPAPLPKPTSEPPAWPLALLPLGLYPLWWIARPRRVLRAVRTKHAGRVAAAQPHPPAPQKQTGVEESATSLFVLPIDKRQHVSIASLDDPPGAAPSFLRREAESRRHARPGTPRERRRAPRRRDLCFSGMSETS
jgi:hypothetical protein